MKKTIKTTALDLFFDRPVYCSVATKSNGPLTKIMRLDPDTGMVVKDGSECWMAEGTLKTESFKSYKQFANGLRRLKPNQCLVHGTSAYDLADVTTIGKLAQVKKNRPADALPIIARSKEHIKYPDGPALMMFDHDKARDNSIAENDSAPKSYRTAELMKLLSTIMPEIANAGYVSTPSTSACISDKDGNELRGEGSGSHIYIIVENGRDIPRFLKVLGKWLLLAGYGRVEISRAGTLLFRTLIDLLVGSPERLDFAAGAICKDGLVQKLPVPIIHDGNHLNTALLLDLSPDEELDYNATIERLTELARPSQAIIKEQYVDQESIKLSTERNISIDEAKQVVLSRQNRVLTDDDILCFAHLSGKAVTVADVLNAPAGCDKKPLADPLEPEYNGSHTTAMFYWNNGKPAIHSYAHGGFNYRFKRLEKVKNGGKFKFISSSDLVFTSPEWLIKNYLEAETTATFFGASGCLKTFILINMGLCIATGKAWYGHKVQKGPVLYVCGEGKAGIKKRIEAWEQHHGMRAPLFFVSESAAQLLDTESLAEVEEAAEEVSETYGKPALIIIDTLNRNFGPGDENFTSDMTKFIQAVDQLRNRLQSAIGIVHHTGLADAGRSRGSSVLRGAMDFEYNCEMNGKTIDEQTVTLTSTKTKDHEAPEAITFKPSVIDLGLADEDNKPVTSLILEPTDKRPATGKKLSRSNGIAIEALSALTANNPYVMEDLWREVAYDRGISSSDKPDSKKKAFNRAKNDLLDSGLIKTCDDIYWLTSSPPSDEGQWDRQGQEGDMSSLSPFH